MKTPRKREYPKAQKICENCGLNYMVEQRRTTQKFCSRECAATRFHKNRLPSPDKRRAPHEQLKIDRKVKTPKKTEEEVKKAVKEYLAKGRVINKIIPQTLKDVGIVTYPYYLTKQISEAIEDAKDPR